MPETLSTSWFMAFFTFITVKDGIVIKVNISTMSIIIPIDIFSWLISANLEKNTVNNPTNPGVLQL